ncbi:MAG: DNA-3-methyladenine glycosylase 2 family protein [Alphaproteobacteria bacterium]|nr:DNA-3-methyladenine glycosylase 2 family protein [Alphaproteobacteria bacterium]
MNWTILCPIMENNIINASSEVPNEMLLALKALDNLDADFKAARACWGNPPDRFIPSGFAALVRIILGQQISRAVANALWARFVERNWQEAQALAALDYEALQDIGLSRRKAEYIIDLAQAETQGQLNLAKLEQQPADIFTQTLISYRGVGGWTISNYRLFCLADLDAWPGNDLALMEAVKRLKNFNERPSHAQMDALAQSWAPYRGAAALMLWHLYACLVRDSRPVS